MQRNHKQEGGMKRLIYPNRFKNRGDSWLRSLSFNKEKKMWNANDLVIVQPWKNLVQASRCASRDTDLQPKYKLACYKYIFDTLDSKFLQGSCIWEEVYDFEVEINHLDNFNLTKVYCRVTAWC
jgi:hypothetical protein